MKNIKKLTSDLFSKTNRLFLVTFVGIYILASGVSLLAFSMLKSSGTGDIADGGNVPTKSRINTTLPKTEACPMNGALFTKEEKALWEKRRPITAVIENHLDSRPQSGLSHADIIYEAIAEGGITRMLGVFYCGAVSEDVRIGPVRSARVYFINWAAEYGNNPLFVHVGGANNICSNCPGGIKPRGDVAPEVDAIKLLINLGWRYGTGNDMDGGTNVGFPIMWRDYERIPGAATEHTYMGSIDKLVEEGASAKRGFGVTDSKGVAWDKGFTTWKFGKDAVGADPKVTTISFEFWKNKPDYNVEWKYDQSKNTYMRFNGGNPHTDMDSKTQLSAKNVVIMLLKEKGPLDKENHMFYANIGTGKALIFKGGEVVEATWSKKTITSRTVFKDGKGAEIEFVPGVIWVEGVPDTNKIEY